MVFVFCKHTVISNIHLHMSKQEPKGVLRTRSILKTRKLKKWRFILCFTEKLFKYRTGTKVALKLRAKPFMNT